MKLTVQQIFNAVPVLRELADTKAKLPTKGAYRVGRMVWKLEPEYLRIAKERDDMIIAYGYKAMVPPPKSQMDPLGQGPLVEAELNSVPPDKADEWAAKWQEFGKMEVTVADIESIPVAQLDLGDSVASTITARQFAMLGDLVSA